MMSGLECRYLTDSHDVQFTTLQTVAEVVRCSLCPEDGGFEGRVLQHISGCIGFSLPRYPGSWLCESLTSCVPVGCGSISNWWEAGPVGLGTELLGGEPFSRLHCRACGLHA